MDRRKFIGISSLFMGATTSLSNFKFVPSVASLNKSLYDAVSNKKFDLFIHPSVFKGEQTEGRIGSSAAIFLSEDKTLIKKQFHSFKLAANGFFPSKKFFLNPKKQYDNEKRAYEKLANLNSTIIPKEVNFSDHDLTITMTYLGEDLHTHRYLFRRSQFRSEFINFLVRSFNEYREAGFIKHTTALSNYYYNENNKEFYSLDYKRITKRTPDNLRFQLRALKHYFKKHLRNDYNKLGLLKNSFSDLDPDIVEKIFQEELS